ncbi:hypothetical protein PRIPAC_72295 [Pristionchus pacificus]|uniref:G protein-coupled receptor n=1 Tax=Pristionchus pacificus TaxID=54126 RepID=A0A2A6C7W2_PRIPA|nr:hypothetical protein PRIPAC_72295 [Pristionchus pacificus]|eukprot:PDM74249.1 G protein-coupled receptor [Pristionchus pacificus]
MNNGSKHDEWKICEDSTSQIFVIMYIVGFYITQFLIGYIICELSVIVHYIIVLCTDNPSGEALKPIDMVRFIVYSYLLPAVLCSTIERLAATIFVTKMLAGANEEEEEAIPSKLQCLRPEGWQQIEKDGELATCNTSTWTLSIGRSPFDEGAAYRLRAYVAIGIELCVYVVIIALFLVNRHRIRQRASSHYAKLTSRFQLAENIRACRFLLIFVFIDSLITITDSVMDVGFSIGTDFDPSRCAYDQSYLPTFAVYHIFTILFELSSPCALATVGHGAYRNQLRKLLGLRNVLGNKRSKTRIWNVSSDQVQTTTNTDNYFTQLTNEWEGPAKNKRKQQDYRRRHTADGMNNASLVEPTQWKVFYITLFFLGYIICELSVVVHYIFVLITDNPDSKVLKPIDMVRFVVYSYLLPAVLCSTIERLAATTFVTKYENMRPWGYVFVSQIVSVAIIVCLNVFVNEGAAYRLRTYMAICIELCVYVVIIALFLVNRHRIRQRASSNYARLTSRFQLVENIRACRFLLIFVFIDSVITITDSVMEVGFNILTDFDPSRCAYYPGYLPTFTAYHSFTILLELTSPCALATVGHGAYRNQLRKLLVQTTATTDQYFTQLTNVWEGPSKNKRIRLHRDVVTASGVRIRESIKM